MARSRPGQVARAVAGVAQPFQEVHVLKPQGVEAFIESAHAQPGLTADQEKRAGRLFDISRFRKIKIQTPVPPVHRIARPQPVQSQ
jgi:hypothetical protein